MKRNFDSELIDLDGGALKKGPATYRMEDGQQVLDKPAEAATLKWVCIMCLRATMEEDSRMKPAEKARLYGLAKRINAGGVVEITTEECVTLKDRLCRMYDTVTFGAAGELLDADLPADAPVDQNRMFMPDVG